jgi:hypothetical protein
MLLMTSGRVVYCGKTGDVLPFVQPYFRPWEAWENPMDYILEFLSQLQPEQADQVRRSAPSCKRHPASSQHHPASSQRHPASS